ncbi:MAG: type IV toxin-antitoxin system AbiEi family antitoxin domain-containing protein, partial [Nocardiopsis sp. BM-2018]
MPTSASASARTRSPCSSATPAAPDPGDQPGRATYRSSRAADPPGHQPARPRLRRDFPRSPRRIATQATGLPGRSGERDSRWHPSGAVARAHVGVEAWDELARRAARRNGVIGPAELDQAGVGRRQIENWVRQRRLERVAPSVWRVAGAPDTWDQRLRVGLLHLGDDAMVSHEAAAQLHGFD